MTAGMAGAGLVRDISDGSLLLRLSGPAAPWLLAKLGSLDFLHGARQGAHCARTRLVDLAAIVYFHPAGDASDVFDLIVDRSYAACLWALLQAAAPHAIELTTSPGNRV